MIETDMKKIYIQPAVSVVAIETNCELLGASGIVNDNTNSKVVESDGDDWAD